MRVACLWDPPKKVPLVSDSPLRGGGGRRQCVTSALLSALPVRYSVRYPVRYLTFHVFCDIRERLRC